MMVWARTKKFFSELPIPMRVFLIIVFLLTLFRVFLAIKIPLHIQAGAVYDDRLLVDYSTNLLSGQWLGNFNQFSLAKGASYSIFLAFNFLLGLPYSFTLIFLYIVAIILFCVAISKILKNKTFLYVLYLLLLYSPVMFHDENVQKIYRGGLITIFALLIVSAIIGLYTRIKEKNKKVLMWSALATISLVFFWFLKEDSIWILPFVCGGGLLTIIAVLKNKIPKREKRVKIFLACLPLIGLVIGILGYKTLNYTVYGEFAITDRQGTYFKNVISDLIHIDGANRSKDNWVTRDMLKKAYSVSPTLSQAKKEIDKSYKGWAKDDGEIEGDIIFWAIKDAVAEAGFYEDGKMANDFYRNVHNELSSAFNDGRLKKNEDFYISAVAKGINMEEVPEFIEHIGESLDNVMEYKYNETGVYPATGDRTGIALFNELTMSQYVDPEANMAIYHSAEISANIANRITSLYKMTGKVLFYGGIIIFALYTVYIIYTVCRKKVKKSELNLFWILFGMMMSCFVLFFGTTFFCRFLSQKKVYDYASPMLPILLATEAILIYVLGVVVKRIIKKIRVISKD